MKMTHIRYLDGWRGDPFESITHYGYRDPLADKLAALLREELSCKARVVQDEGSGYRHVFVPLSFAAQARDIACTRPGF